MKKLILSVALLIGVYTNTKAQALNFDGVDDYIATPLDADKDVMPSTTWEAWVYPTTNDGNWRMVFSMEDGGWDRFVAFNGGGIYIGVSSGGWNPTTMTVNQWQHIAVVFTPGDVRFYLNGVEYLYGQDEGSHLSAGLFTIGANEAGTQNFQGTLDEVRVWDIARTQAQIQDNMNCSLPAQADLVANYTFDGGAAIPNQNNAGITLVMDNSGNSNTGTLTNFALTGTNSNWVNNVTTLNPVAYATVAAGITTIAAGSTVSFTATPINGGSAPAYQWIKNHMNVGTNSNVYADNTLLNKDTVTCMITSSGNCITKDSISNKTGITVVNSLAASLNFDGQDDYVDLGSALLNNLSAFTLEGWINMNNSPVDSVSLFGQHYAIETTINATNLIIWTSATGTTEVAHGFATNTWNHIAFVGDGSTLKIYINGVEKINTATGTISNYGYSKFTAKIGDHVSDATNSNPFDGNLDEIHFWNIARTAAQIQNDMNCTFTTAQTGLLANYNFNEGTPNANNTGIITLNDISGNNNNGTLNNFDLSGGPVSNWTDDVNKVSPLPAISISGVNSICIGATTTLTINGTAATYTWSANASSAITASVSVNPANTATYNVTGANASCMATDSIVVTVNQLPAVTFNVNPTSYCSTAASVTLTASPSGGTYSGTAVSGNQFDPNTAGAGTYTLSYTYTDANTCSNMDTAVVTIQACATGIDQLTSTNVSSYPNPTGSDLYIQTATALDNATVEVYDMIGQKVLVEKLHDTITRLSIGTLNNAIYQVRVLNNNALIYQTKVVKQQ